MITEEQRRALGNLRPPSGCVGYDCEGRHIKNGDTVEVVIEDKDRKDNPEYAFCAKDCRGTVSQRTCPAPSWFVSVRFERATVGCLDYHLRIVS